MRRIGTEKPLTSDERAHLVGELTYWTTRSNDFYSGREREEKAFNQVWKGQTPNGLRMDTDEEEAWPFDGASDQRVRWGDTAFQELLALLIVALDMCKVEVVCDGTPDGTRRAGAIARLLTWCRQKIGAKWYIQISALLRYTLVDSPAVGAMDVGWATKLTMGVATLDSKTLQEEYTAWRVNSGEVAESGAAQEWALALGGEDEAAMERAEEFLTTLKGCREDDIDDILEALFEEGECEALVAASKWEGPEIKALRFGDDFMIPAGTEDFDYADPLFRQEWLTETELRELAAHDEWSQEWVEETLKNKGTNFYDTRDYDHAEDMKNMVNIVWCYTTEVNENGETTRWVSVLSQANGSAFGKRVLRSRRGKWETVFFQREALANNCLASRGLAHICAPDQGLAKCLKDFANDNAIVGSLPSVKAKGGRVRNVVLEPFGVINMGQNDDVAFMQPPAYPASAKEQIKAIRDDLYAFLGLSNGETDVSTRTTSFTAFMLSQFVELYRRLVESAQDYASDAALASVTGEADTQGLRHEDLDGDFQLMLKFNPANMNHKDLIERVTALGQVIAPLDAKNEIDRGPVVRNAFLQLFPECQGASFKSTDEIVGDDLKDEEQNFVKIKAGIMPQMDTEGKWNYAARLEWHQRMQQENPDAIAEMSPASQDIYQRWIQALEQMNTQFGENAEIGKTGVRGVSAAE